MIRHLREYTKSTINGFFAFALDYSLCPFTHGDVGGGDDDDDYYSFVRVSPIYIAARGKYSLCRHSLPWPVKVSRPLIIR